VLSDLLEVCGKHSFPLILQLSQKKIHVSYVILATVKLPLNLSKHNKDLYLPDFLPRPNGPKRPQSKMRYFVLRDADYFWSYDPSENYKPYSFLRLLA
jgi:hypothetical protein